MTAAACGYEDCFTQWSAVIVSHGNGLAPVASCFNVGAASCDVLATGGHFSR